LAGFFGLITAAPVSDAGLCEDRASSDDEEQGGDEAGFIGMMTPSGHDQEDETKCARSGDGS
jgi:hypothetical protein